MSELNANLVAVQWGVLSVFGVVVALLLPPTDRYRQEFLTSGADEAQRRAARWARSVKTTSMIVLLPVTALTILGARDTGLSSVQDATTTTFWLLMTPLLAQLGFVALVFSLVRRVPPVLQLLAEQPPKHAASAHGRRDRTIIRYVNETSAAMDVVWIDANGLKDPRGPLLTVEAGKDVKQDTYEGHRFVVSIKGGEDICSVVAQQTPGMLTIGPGHLKRSNVVG